MELIPWLWSDAMKQIAKLTWLIIAMSLFELSHNPYWSSPVLRRIS